MRRAAERPGRRACALALALGVLSAPATEAAAPASACDRPVYLTFDTGHMGVADLVADVLRRHGVRATFFLANERTLSGGASLDEQWAGWWRARAAEGHAFGSHTWDHDVWRADLPEGRLRVRPTQGPHAGRDRLLDAAGYCDALAQPARRFQQMTGQPMSAVFRAPAGKVSAGLRAAADMIFASNSVRGPPFTPIFRKPGRIPVSPIPSFHSRPKRAASCSSLSVRA